MKRTIGAIASAAAIIATFTAGGAGAGPIGKHHQHVAPPSTPPSVAPPCGVETIVLDVEAPPLKHKKPHFGQQLASGNEPIRLVFVNEHHGKHHHVLVPPPPPIVVTVPCTNEGAPGGTGAGGIDGAGETPDGDEGGAGGTNGAPGGTNSSNDDIVVDLGAPGPGEPDLGTGTDETTDGLTFVTDVFEGFTFVSDTVDFNGSAPEPSTLALLGLGLVGLARKRRTRGS